MAAVFVASVATYRGVSEDTVLEQYGQGGVMVGQRATDAGLADRLGSYESLLAEMSERGRKAANRPFGATSARTGKEDVSMPTMWDKFVALMKGTDADADADGPAPSGDGDAKALRAEVQALRNEREQREKTKTTERLEELSARAETFVAQQVNDKRILPGEVEALTGDLIQAAEDDILNPLASGSRFERKQKQVLARPQHVLCEELAEAGVRPEGTVVLLPKLKQPEPGKPSGPLDAKRRKELMAHTPLGKAVLAGEKGGK
jgi:hypothetical protein